MVAAYLRDRKGIYYTLLEYYDENGKRQQIAKSTGLKVKGNSISVAHENIYLLMVKTL